MDSYQENVLIFNVETDHFGFVDHLYRLPSGFISPEYKFRMNIHGILYGEKISDDRSERTRAGVKAFGFFSLDAVKPASFDVKMNGSTKCFEKLCAYIEKCELPTNVTSPFF